MLLVYYSSVKRNKPLFRLSKVLLSVI